MENCCGENDIIISDVYSIEDDNKSRFISVDRIPGQHVQSKYIYTIQEHNFEYDKNILKITFYHDLIDDNDLLDTGSIRTVELKFGTLQIGIENDELKGKKIDDGVIEAINNIRITHFDGVDICYKNSKTVNLIPNELKNIGVVNYEVAAKRKTITIKLEDNTVDSIIEILFGNIDLIYQYLDDKDLVKFEAKDHPEILRTYILTNSKGYKEDPNELGGMGPKINGFDCIYVKN